MSSWMSGQPFAHDRKKGEFGISGFAFIFLGNIILKHFHAELSEGNSWSEEKGEKAKLFGTSTKAEWKKEKHAFKRPTLRGIPERTTFGRGFSFFHAAGQRHP